MRVEIDALARASARAGADLARPRAGRAAWPSKHGVARARRRARRTTPLARRRDDVLHLHRLHHEQRLAGARRASPAAHVDARRSCPAAARARRRCPRARRRRAPARGSGASAGAPCRSRARRADRARSTRAPASAGAARGAGGRLEVAARLRARPRRDELGGVLLDEARVHAVGARASGGASRRLQEAAGWSRRPRSRNSPSARQRAREQRPRSRADGECTITFASSESKRGFVA